MKKRKPLSQMSSPEHRAFSVSRRDFMRGIGAVAGLAALPKALHAAEAVGDLFVITDSEREELKAKSKQRFRERYEREDELTIANAIKHNQAKLVKEVRTESGLSITVMQAQTGQNPDVEMLVDEVALSQSVSFLINAMDEVNNKNGKPIDPSRIKKVQDRARAGRLDNIQMTVIMSGTIGFHTPDGILTGGGATFNGHPYGDEDPREILRPLICFSPDIYNPNEETLTPVAVTGEFFGEEVTKLESFKPTAAQSLTAYFAHEASHALLDVLGTSVMEDLAWNDDNPEHNAGAYEHKAFVSPLSWLHSGAIAGIVKGQPVIPPSFIVPKLL